MPSFNVGMIDKIMVDYFVAPNFFNVWVFEVSSNLGFCMMSDLFEIMADLVIEKLSLSISFEYAFLKKKKCGNFKDLRISYHLK